MKSRYIAFVIILSAVTASLSPAADTSPQPYTPKDKFIRGASDVWYAPKEVPHNIDAMRTSGPFQAWTEGLARGIGRTVVRAGTGIFEMATFYWKAPKNYEPYLEPESPASR